MDKCSRLSKRTHGCFQSQIPSGRERRTIWMLHLELVDKEVGQVCYGRAFMISFMLNTHCHCQSVCPQAILPMSTWWLEGSISWVQHASSSLGNSSKACCCMSSYVYGEQLHPKPQFSIIFFPWPAWPSQDAQGFLLSSPRSRFTSHMTPPVHV